MNLTALVAQFPITLSVKHNLDYIQQVLNIAQVGDLVVFPEGAISGYSTDLSFLEKIDSSIVAAGLADIKQEASRRKIHVWIGACYQADDRWFNAAWGFTPDEQTFKYHKVNLATHERGVFTPGKELPVFNISTPNGDAKIGVQLCREIRYPEQWGWLARSGAEIILHLNNAVGNAQDQSVWRSHLVSRAAELQRYVISANNAGLEQKCPTIAISPGGQVLDELCSDQPGLIRVDLDLSQVSNWYLDQRRTDI